MVWFSHEPVESLDSEACQTLARLGLAGRRHILRLVRADTDEAFPRLAALLASSRSTLTQHQASDANLLPESRQRYY